MTVLEPNQNSSLDASCFDTSIFLNWSEDPLESVHDKAVVFRSLVATVKLQSALDASLETKAVKFLESVVPKYPNSADAFLGSFSLLVDDYSTDFLQSIVVLLSSTSHAITTAAMKVLNLLICRCSTEVRLALVKADLIPQIINTLRPYSISFEEAEDTHTKFMNILDWTLWLATPEDLAKLEIEDPDEQQAVRDTVLKQVLVPSEKYICLLCANRYSIIDGGHTESFMDLLNKLLEISPSYRPTMQFILHLPVVMTIPSYVTFFETENQILCECNEKGGEQRQMWNKILRILRMEGIEDVVDRCPQTPTLLSTVDDEIRWDGNLETETILQMGTSKETSHNLG
ncbi:hypothetical protein BLNAU_3371 [Blattamonas nauphoetae]|uniref:Uncharacterized protein n=1 Tax=Blattamonas nauphoetae TaxID=2049346 RepID=A0ABQ9YCU0_9EUKA|nr:hypothetical protein BLNAU_3371 [Blattamonas nauphoetae]